MKILILCNLILPEIANSIGKPAPNAGGWIVSTVQQLREENELYLCCFGGKTQKAQGEVNGLKYFVFGDRKRQQIRDFQDILKKNKPDIIHIFGTEYVHTHSMCIAAEREDLIDRVVVNIQGLISVCVAHYDTGLPYHVRHCFSLRDLLRLENLNMKKRKSARSGQYEVAVLSKVKHVVGRTEWDYACVRLINPNIQYHFCNETLRNAFYESQWSYDECDKHVLFVSQCNYPIKGFHYLIEAVMYLVRKYPDIKVYTTGKPMRTARDMLSQTYYRKYLEKKIKEYGLSDHIIFDGQKNDIQMRDMYLKANVFVSPSLIENSPNSVGEAMLLGVPVVSSDVGGVKSLMTHEKEGLLYPVDEPYMLAHYIDRIFSDRGLAETLSVNARNRAKKTHDQRINHKTMISIYRQICNDKYDGRIVP